MPVTIGLAALFLLNLSSFRGIWIPRWSLDTDFEKIVRDVSEVGFNHCFVQIFALGESYYPSSCAPNKYFPPGRQLHQFIKNAHNRNIKVHAWVNLFYIWSHSAQNSDPQHPINSKPDWFVWTKDGRPMQSLSSEQIRNAGIEGYYLAPANYWVQEYLKSIILEIVTDYDFDGIHLDYVRYPANDFAYDPATRAKFFRQIYIDPEELFNNYPSLISRLGRSGYNDLYRRWFQFLCDDLSDFVYRLNIEIKRKKPGVYLSAAVKPDPVKARQEYYQDWVTWINRGYIDFVCTMTYTKDLKFYLTKINKEVLFQDRVMIGLGLYIQSPEEIYQQVNLLKNYDYGGVIFFSYEHLQKNRSYATALK